MQKTQNTHFRLKLQKKQPKNRFISFIKKTSMTWRIFEIFSLTFQNINHISRFSRLSRLVWTMKKGFAFLYTGERSANFNLSGYSQSLKIPSFHIFCSIGPDTSKVSNRHFGEIFLKLLFLETFSFLISISIFSMVVSEKWNSDIFSPTDSSIFKTLEWYLYFKRATSTWSEDSKSVSVKF